MAPTTSLQPSPDLAPPPVAALPDDCLALALPKGRIAAGVQELLAAAGIRVRVDARGYRPVLSEPWLAAKLLKPQNIVQMLASGSRDVGFAGADWVAELEADVVELLDTGLDPVRVVAAAPTAVIESGRLEAGGSAPDGRPTIVATEYERLTSRWLERRGLSARVLRTWGATEVFPPEDADAIVDNTSTGATLRENGLQIVDEVLRSSTRLYCNPRVLDDPLKAEAVDRLVLLLRSVLEARARVLLELNVPAERLDALMAALPAMKQPTVAPLHGSSGFAVKAAVPRDALPTLIPALKACGGSDLLVSSPGQIVP